VRGHAHSGAAPVADHPMAHRVQWPREHLPGKAHLLRFPE
jgi:hypothetical protein